MELVNDTPLEATLVRNTRPGDVLQAIVVIAATFSLDRVPPGKRTQPPAELKLARQQKPVQVGAGEVPGDGNPYREGLSVCAIGFAYPEGEEGTKADASLLVGEQTLRIAVFGARVWRGGLVQSGLTPTQPLPFRRIPMQWDQAFGGKVAEKARVIAFQGEDMIMPPYVGGFALNPDGRGFYTTKESAIDQPLPALEHPDQLVARWDDRPEPVCFGPCPPWAGVRGFAVVKDGLSSIDPMRTGRLLNRASPRNTFDGVGPGTRIELSGMCSGGAAFAFTVPEPPVRVRLEVGPRTDVVACELDGVDIHAEESVARVVYRVVARVPLIQNEVRTAIIEAARPLAQSPV